MSSVWVVSEDAPGLAVLRRLVADCPPLTVYKETNARGFGALKRDARKYDKTARAGLPVVLLTDLDRASCPAELRDSWLGNTVLSPRFLFRVARREVEAWLLADAAAFATHFRVKPTSLPTNPEGLPDPKRALFEVLAKGPKKTTAGMLPAKGAPVGPEYNARLKDFVEKAWRPEVAATRAPSLCRARYRLGWLAASCAGA